MPSESAYECMGRKVRVRDSLGTYLLVIELLNDARLDVLEKMSLLYRMVLANPDGFIEAFAAESHAALCEVLDKAFGIDLTGAAEPHERVIDWDGDAPMIAATVRNAYGMSYDQLKELPYREACALISWSPSDTPMGRALYYRTAKPPKRTKHNKEQVEEFERMRKAFRLGANGPMSIEAANAAATAEFDAFERRLRNVK